MAAPRDVGWGRGSRFGPLLERGLGVCAGAVLLAMMALTAADVVARYLFDAPIDGAFELTELLLAALIFLALPLTTRRREHVEVDLLEIVASRRLNAAARSAGLLLSAAALAVIAWQLAVQGRKLLDEGTVTNTLELPYWPLAFLAATTVGTSAAIALALALRPGPGGGELDG